MLDLNDLTRQSQVIAKKREKHGVGADTMSCLKHCAEEIVEAVDAYNDWQTDSKLGNNYPDWYVDYKKEYAGELADIIICVLIAAANSNIDIEQALKDCVEKNRKRAECIGDKL